MILNIMICETLSGDHYRLPGKVLENKRRDTMNTLPLLFSFKVFILLIKIRYFTDIPNSLSFFSVFLLILGSGDEYIFS
jgi:hypothetical protein